MMNKIRMIKNKSQKNRWKSLSKERRRKLGSKSICVTNNKINLKLEQIYQSM